MSGAAEALKALGELMAAVRREKGVGLDEMARDTKIRRVVLEALEEGRTADLPPDIFVVGFIRSYGGRLGVDAEPWVRRYEEIRRRAESALAPQEPRRTFPARAAWAVGGLMAAAAVTGALWYLVASGRFSLMEPVVSRPVTAVQTPPVSPPVETPQQAAPGGDESQPNGPGAGAPAPLGGEAGEMEPAAGTEQAAAEPGGQAEPNPPPAQAAEPPRQVAQGPAPKGDLVMTCKEDCWVELYAGETRLLHRVVGAGEVLAFQGSSFTADIGNAGGVSLTFRGVQIPLPDKSGMVIKGLRIPSPVSGAEGR